jgi:hypothetical protein
MQRRVASLLRMQGESRRDARAGSGVAALLPCRAGAESSSAVDAGAGVVLDAEVREATQGEHRRGAGGRRGGRAPSLPELTAAGHRPWSGGGLGCGSGTSGRLRERRNASGVSIHGRSSGNCRGPVSRYVKELGFTVGGSLVETGLIFWASAVWDLEAGVEAQKKSPLEACCML